MTIKELNHKPELEIKNCIVALSYDEVRDIANGMYLLVSRIENPSEELEVTDTEKECFKTVKNSFAVLFDLVKHGRIQQHTIDYCTNPPEMICPADCLGPTANALADITSTTRRVKL